jgi:hypothetical protein
MLSYLPPDRCFFLIFVIIPATFIFEVPLTIHNIKTETLIITMIIKKL